MKKVSAYIQNITIPGLPRQQSPASARRSQGEGAFLAELRPDVAPALAAQSSAVSILGFAVAHRLLFPSDSNPPGELFLNFHVDLFRSPAWPGSLRTTAKAAPPPELPSSVFWPSGATAPPGAWFRCRVSRPGARTRPQYRA